MKAFRAVALLFSLASYVFGQQLITTTNAAGVIVVEEVTSNAFGQLVTQTLETLGQATSLTTTPTSTGTTLPTTTATTTTPTSTNTRATTTTPVQQGPVGQPASTPETPGGPTPYTYTTTDANGDYTAVVATFIPTFPATTPYTPTSTGTILQYSEWLSQIGTNTGDLNEPVASQAANPAWRASANIRLLSSVVLTSVLAVVLGGWVLIP